MERNSKAPYSDIPTRKSPVIKEGDLEDRLIQRLQSLKYDYRPDITNRASIGSVNQFNKSQEGCDEENTSTAVFIRLEKEMSWRFVVVLVPNSNN